MNTHQQVPVYKENIQADVDQKSAVKLKGKRNLTALALFRGAGLSAMVAGFLYVFIQMIHPPELLSTVTSGAWANVHYLTFAMCLFWLLGMVGIYVKQAEKAGWLGLAGFLLFSLFLVLSASFNFAEALIIPLLAADAPKFVEGFLGIFSGAGSEVNLGVLAAIGPVGGILYLSGGVVFGIATFRAGVLSRWGGAIFAFGAVASLGAAVLPHELDRLMAVPMGIGIAWLGYSLLKQRR
ncbi:hypothetical protein [Planococcus glaciei]|uniref:hypothetical protein n=1 Tax=Planococcus glaciei TaxID=459472 RepID=UPI001F1D72AC|nr:hypothetical protein [Planococcus glaciei]